MKTFLKIFAGLILLLLIAVAGFLYTFDANAYKEEMTQLAEALTGRKVTLAGDIKISLLPWTGLKVNNMIIDNRQGFNSKTFARVGEFDIKVEPWPLLQKRLNIESLVLKELTVNFEKSHDGSNNWSDFMLAAGGKNVESKYGLAGLVIGGIEVENANLVWLDSASGQEFRVSKMNLQTEAVVEGEPLPLTFKAYIKSNYPHWQGGVLAKTRLEFKEGSPVFNAKELKLAVKASFPKTEMESVSFTLFADSEINVQTQQATLSEAKIKILGLVIDGNLEVDNIFSVPVIQGPVKINTFNAYELAERLNIQIPETNEQSSLKNITVECVFRTDFESIFLHDVAANIDDSNINGFIHVTEIDKLDINYDLDIDSIDLGRYSLVAAQPDQQELALPVDLIKTSSVGGTLDVETAIVGDVELKQIRIKSSIRSGILQINPLTLLVEDSNIQATMQYDVRTQPSAVFELEANNIPANAGINPLLKTIIGEDAITVDGPANAVARIQARGADMSSLKNTANGLLKINMSKARIKGIDLEHATRSIVADYANKNNFRTRESFVTEYRPDHETEFSSLKATFKISRGKLINDDLLLVSESANISGSGSIDFINEKLDYAPVIDMKVNNAIDIRDKLRDHPIEYHAYGNFRALSYEPEMEKYELLVGRLLRQEAKARRFKQQKQTDWQKYKSR